MAKLKAFPLTALKLDSGREEGIEMVEPSFLIFYICALKMTFAATVNAMSLKWEKSRGAIRG